MKIVKQRGDESGADMKLGVVQEDGRSFVYFLSAGTDTPNPEAPHFIIKPAIAYGDVGAWVFDFNAMVENFVCPDFADREELIKLRAESVKWQGTAAEPGELEKLRAESAELARIRENRTEAAKLRARLAELEGQELLNGR